MSKDIGFCRVKGFELPAAEPSEQPKAKAVRWEELSAADRERLCAYASTGDARQAMGLSGLPDVPSTREIEAASRLWLRDQVRLYEGHLSRAIQVSHVYPFLVGLKKALDLVVEAQREAHLAEFHRIRSRSRNDAQELMKADLAQRLLAEERRRVSTHADALERRESAPAPGAPELPGSPMVVEPGMRAYVSIPIPSTCRLVSARVLTRAVEVESVVGLSDTVFMTVSLMNGDVHAHSRDLRPFAGRVLHAGQVIECTVTNYGRQPLEVRPVLSIERVLFVERF